MWPGALPVGELWGGGGPSAEKYAKHLPGIRDTWPILPHLPFCLSHETDLLDSLSGTS